MRFQVITAVNLHVVILWGYTQGKNGWINQRFRRTYCLHFHFKSRTEAVDSSETLINGTYCLHLHFKSED
jgi:hypothetical protein